MMDYLIDPPEPTKAELRDDVERLEKEVRQLEAQIVELEEFKKLKPCVWLKGHDYPDRFYTACPPGGVVLAAEHYRFCPFCGHRVEVKP